MTWTNPCGAIALSPEVQAQYQSAYLALQTQWYTTHPGIDQNCIYTYSNPLAALAYPPGFLKRNLIAAAIFFASSPDTDGYFWCNDRWVSGIDSYARLNAALWAMAPVDMLILSGEEMELDEACGVCWREYGTHGFDVHMPEATAALLHHRITDAGLLVMGSCRSGDTPAMVQMMADRIGRPVAGAKDVCRGVRKDFLVEDGVPWTLGGYAEGGGYTLAFPS